MRVEFRVKSRSATVAKSGIDQRNKGNERMEVVGRDFHNLTYPRTYL